MIFVTVGAQIQFDRLIKTVDQWAAHYDGAVFGQIGNSNYFPENFEYKQFLKKIEYDEILKTTSLIISHAGMGTIISAMELEKKIIIMPRLAQFREHRNDHQYATAQAFQRYGVTTAFNEDQLLNFLQNIQEVQPCTKIGKFASKELLYTIEQFIKSR